MSRLSEDAAARKAVPIYSGFIAYFPDAMIEVATEEQAREIARQFMELHRLHWPALEFECEARPLDEQG